MKSFYILIFSLTLFSFNLLGQSFTNLNGFPGGKVQSIQFDAAGNIYAVNRSDGRIYKSTDNGGTWSIFSPSNANVYDFKVDGADMYYSDYSNFYKSTDSGQTWSRVSGNNTFRNTSRILKLPVGNNFVVHSGCEGVFASSDGGVNWSKISSNQGCTGGEYKTAYASNGDIYFEDTAIGILRHAYPTDGVWDVSKVTVVFPKLISGSDNNLSVFVNAFNKVYITHTNAAGTQQVIETSATGNSGSFAILTGPTTSFDSPKWSVSASGKIYFFGGGAGFFELTNEATPTWTVKTLPASAYNDYTVLSFAWKSATEVYAGIDGGGVFRSTDTGATWTVKNGTMASGIITPWGSDVEILGNGTIVVKEQNGTKGVWTSSDQGATFVWRSQTFLLYGSFGGQRIVKLQDNSLITTSSVGIRRSTDGITWTIQGNPPNALDAFLPVGGSDIYGFGINGAIGKSTDLGVNWTTISVTGLPANYRVLRSLTVAGNYFIVIQNDGLNQTEYWKLDASAPTWVATKLVTPLRSEANITSGFFELNGKIYAGDLDKVAYSPDQGVNWTTINYPHNALMPIRQGVGGIGLGNPGALLVTQDDGVNWSNITLSNPKAFVKDIAQDAGTNFYAVCENGPVVKFSGNLILPPAEIPPSINFSWQPLGGPNGGQVKRVLKNSTGQLFALSLEALLKSNTATSSWDRLTVTEHFYDFSDAIIDNANKIYAIDSYQLLTSANGGTTWTRASGQINDARKILKTTNGNLVVTSGSGLYVSVNDGVSFTSPVTANSGSFVAAAAASTGQVFAAKLVNGNSALMKSTDNGLTWTNESGVDLSSGKEVLSIAALEAGAIGVVTSDNIYKWTNSGGSWTSIKGNLTTFYNSNDSYWKQAAKLYVSPTNEYYFSNQLSLYKSIDNGATWIKQSDTPVSFLDITFANAKMYAGTLHDGVYESADDGVSFVKYLNNKNLHGFYYTGLELVNNKIWSKASYNKFYSSADNGTSFTSVGLTDYVDGLTKLPNGDLVAFAGTFVKSVDGGISWNSIGPDPGYYSLLATPDGVTFYAVRDNNGVRTFVKSTDLQIWTEQTATGMPTNFNVETLAADLAGNIYFTGYNSEINNGELYRLSFGALTRIDEVAEPGSIDYANGKLYAFSRQGAVYESSDGISWVRRSTPGGTDKLLITENNYFFIGNQFTGDLWLSRNQGLSWQNVGGFKYDDFIKVKVDLTSGYAYALAQNRPVLKSSAIIIPDDNTAPVMVSLSPATTTINIPLDFKINITFDEPVKGVSGKKVRLLDAASPGTPLEIFDATAGVLSNGNKTVSFTPTISIGYLKNYFVIVDSEAFTDIYPTNKFVGITSNTAWTFTTIDEPDLLDPVLAGFSSANLSKGVPLIFEVTVTDNKAINTSSTKIYYRGISTLESAVFQSAALTQVSGGTATNSKFNVTVNESWYDGMGLEFYFEAEDLVGKKARLPATDYFYSYIRFGTEAANKPKVSGIAFGATESSYRIISVPHKLEDNQIATQFDELGAANRANWRILAYNGTEVYDEFPNQLKTLGRGVGYWIISKDAKDVFLENASTPENNRTNFLTINLKEGWNLVGNPYTVPISWEEARGGNSAIGVIKKYTGGTYANGDILAPGEGGFVNASQAIAVKIRFQGITSGGRISKLGSDLAEDQWEVPLFLYQGNRGSEIAGIGMHMESSEEVDGFDDFNPPSPQQMVEINFKTNKGKSLAKNIVPTQSEYAWELTAVAEAEGSATIKWDPTVFGDNAKEVYLFDVVLQRKVNMRNQQSYTYHGDQSRKFKIYFGEHVEKKIVPTLSLLGNPYPNPSSAAVTVPFTIQESSSAAAVLIEVYNTLGKQVAVITSKEFSPGFHEQVWDYTSLGIQSGVYFVRMINNQKGELNNQIKKIIIH